MNIFIDVDGTLVGQDGSLRPHASSVLQSLTSQGHRLYLWSLMGPRWQTVEEHGMKAFVSDCVAKPMTASALWRLSRGIASVGHPRPDLCVDDAPLFVDAFGGVVVRSYLTAEPEDRELLRAYNAICDGRYRKADPAWKFFWKSRVPVLPLLFR